MRLDQIFRYALYAAFAVFSFKELIVLNVWLYSLSLLVELGAFVRLRVTAADMPRPWRVPGGHFIAVSVVAFPVLFCVVAMATAGWMNTIAGVTAAITGPLAYRLLGRRRFSSMTVARQSREPSE